MAIQDTGQQERFVQRYEMLRREAENAGLTGEEDHLNNSTQPYHYGSHYSNSGSL